MVIKRFETLVRADIQAVWTFHSSAEALKVLTPPGRKMRWVSTNLSVYEGAVHEFRFKVGPLWLTWSAKLSAVHPPHGFVDTALKSPFKSWTHQHEFIPQGSGTVIRDTIEYVPRFGFLGAFVDKCFLSRDIDRLFAFRHEATKQALEAA